MRRLRILCIVLAAWAVAPAAPAAAQKLTYHQLPEGGQPAHVARGAAGGVWFEMLSSSRRARPVLGRHDT